MKLPYGKLQSGGIITNYRCSASCRHCLYGCSPKAEGGYIAAEMSQRICEILKRAQCPSVHIGGGEPFLNVEGLNTLLQTIRRHNLSLDYIETNGDWITRDDKRNREILDSIRKSGGNCIMVSVDPFHAEFVPLWKPFALIDLLKDMGFDYFIWQEKFVRKFLNTDLSRPLSYETLQSLLGANYVAETAMAYGLSYNGRALNILREHGEAKEYSIYLEGAPCLELKSTSHFHIDYLGYYVPSMCTGIGVPVDLLTMEILGESKYPLLYTLLERGLKGLFEKARANGFQPKQSGYVSKCEFCLDMRKYFLKGNDFYELSPKSFYSQNF